MRTSMHAVVFVGLQAVTSGCGPTVSSASDTNATDTGQPGSSTSSFPGTTTDPGTTAASTSSAGDGDDSNDGGSTSAMDPAPQPPAYQCDTFEQGCPAQQKCVFYAADGSNQFSGTHCVPINASPVPDGAPCTYEGILSGRDNCQLGSMCWNVAPGTDAGECHSFCSGTPAAPVCPSGYTCAGTSDVNLCLPECDPVAQDCPPTQVCVPADEHFLCAETGGDVGDGEPCEFANECQVGSACLNPNLTPACEGVRCCAEFCEVGSSCELPGTSCLPWHEDGQAPPEQEHVGICGAEPL